MKIFITFPNGVDADDYALLKKIQARGNLVTFEKYQRYTPSQFAREHGCHPGSISRLLHRPGCPKFVGKIGPTGRVIHFLNSFEITDYLLANLK